jgi:hypothetical protein
MLTKKSIGVALACALAVGAFSGSAFASTMNVGGVVYDPNSSLDLTIQAVNFRESAVSAPDDVLMGYGQIGTINGALDQDFCPNCDLTFTFQYTVKDVDDTGPQPRIVFDNGSVNFYTTADGSFDVSDPSSATAGGSLWLSTVGHTAPQDGYNAVGQLYATINGTPGAPEDGSAGFGLLDVTGGPEARYTDTNTLDDGNGGFADFRLHSSFLNDDSGICGADGTCYPVSGTGGLKGASAMPVPEPAELGLFGLGLGALGVFFLRRRKEADNAA